MSLRLKTPLTRSQRSPGIRGKIESALARLGRLGAEAGATGSGDELERQTVLFE